jgi:tetratricopeptide (TPR) repeat protein
MIRCEGLKSKIPLFLLTLFLFASCSHFPFFRGAESEFDSGLALFNQGRYEEAIPYFRKASEIDPKYTKAYLYLGRSYLNLGRFLEAIPPLRTTLELSPDGGQKEIVNLLVDALMGARLLPGKE